MMMTVNCDWSMPEDDMAAMPGIGVSFSLGLTATTVTAENDNHPIYLQLVGEAPA